MNIVIIGLVVTILVISLGVVMIIPNFTTTPTQTASLLIFEVNDDKNLPQWCDELSSFLNTNKVDATVFVSGKIVEIHPQCVNKFHSGVDIGSQTYSYISLTTISDYQQQLDEVQKGKEVVDSAGNLDSKLFRAPYGQTDDNIYSLLTRNNIIADFSYENQYNKFHNGQFLKFDVNSVSNPENIVSLGTEFPVFVTFDNSVPISKISSFISEVDSKKIRFVSASELTGLQLTVRGA